MRILRSAHILAFGLFLASGTCLCHGQDAPKEARSEPSPNQTSGDRAEVNAEEVMKGVREKLASAKTYRDFVEI